MKVASDPENTLWTRTVASGALAGRFLACGERCLELTALAQAAPWQIPAQQIEARSVLIAVHNPLQAALALRELDGLAARVVLCPPGYSAQSLRHVAAQAQADAVILDEGAEASAESLTPALFPIRASARLLPVERPARTMRSTEWILLTSGSTGQPKLVAHTLDSLAGHVHDPAAPGRGKVWGTFYDIRRYGGLQILLRALCGNASLLMAEPGESVAAFLARAAAVGVTHLTGTPSHWRAVLMSGQVGRIAPAYVRLSGEIADQAILDGLRAAYPQARIVHAFASTEAGLAFEVADGIAGVPAQLLQSAAAGAADGIELRLEEGSLLVRSARTASAYLGEGTPLRRTDGFVDTQDVLELREGRYHFLGRRGGVINIGGLKCHPEEIESVINRHPAVRGSVVKARRNPLLGSIVVADVVLQPDDPAAAAADPDLVRRQILEDCRRTLSAHKVPAAIRIVPSLDLSPAGKLQRTNA
jgi:acyl-coenzyme A synthetase/AMP-(fatty) acid ligase